MLGAQRSQRSVAWILVALAVILTLYAARETTRANLETQYVLIIDAGSSGTRLHAFSWVGRDGALAAMPAAAGSSASTDRKTRAGATPALRRGMLNRVETTPGLDQFVGDFRGLEGRALGPLLDWAKAAVPQHAWASTRVLLMGTAGLRRLPYQQSSALLVSVKLVLRDSPFALGDVRLLSGRDEGALGWAAVNREGSGGRGHMRSRSKVSLGDGGTTTGVLDLGGSSLEMCYESAEAVGDDAVGLALGPGKETTLYCHVHHHLGLNDAFDASVTRLLVNATLVNSRSLLAGVSEGDGDTPAAPRGPVSRGGPGRPNGPEGSTPQGASPLVARRTMSAPGEASSQGPALPTIVHPCLHKGYRARYRRARDRFHNPEPPEVELVGGADRAACQALARALGSPATGDSCVEAPACTLGVPRPLTAAGFVATSGFAVVHGFFGVDADSRGVTPNASVGGSLGTPPMLASDVAVELRKGAAEHCATPWDQVVALRGVDEPFLEQYCFRSWYVDSLLEEGLGLERSSVRLEKNAGGGWPRGAALEAKAKEEREGSGATLSRQVPARARLAALVALAALLGAAAHSRREPERRGERRRVGSLALLVRGPQPGAMGRRRPSAGDLPLDLSERRSNQGSAPLSVGARPALASLGSTPSASPNPATPVAPLSPSRSGLSSTSLSLSRSATISRRPASFSGMPHGLPESLLDAASLERAGAHD